MSICVGCRVLVPGLLWRTTNWAPWDIWVLFSQRPEVRSLKQILAVLLAAETDAGRFVPWKVLLLVAPHMFCPRTERNGIGAGIKPLPAPAPLSDADNVDGYCVGFRGCYCVGRQPGRAVIQDHTHLWTLCTVLFIGQAKHAHWYNHGDSIIKVANNSLM